MSAKQTQHRLSRWIVGAVLLCSPLSAVAATTMNFPADFNANIGSFLSLVDGMLYFLTWIVFYFLRNFLDPNTVFAISSSSSLLAILNNVWQLARDVVNIVFALVLVLGAIYTIVTAKKDLIMNHWAKFVMAVILVNFSWFFPLVVIDVANIATATVYGIPSLLGSSVPACKVISSKILADQNCVADGKVFKCDCAYIEDMMFFLDTEEYSDKVDAGWECYLKQLMCVKKSPLNLTTATPSAGVLNGLVVNHANLQALANIPPPGDKSEIGQILEFLMREGMLLFFLVLLLFPLAAMLIAFIIRIPVLWITIAFMPFYFVQFVLPDKLTQNFSPKKIMDTFLQAAFLPVMLAVPLTVGFIMVNAGVEFTASPAAFSINNFNFFSNVSTTFQFLWILMAMGVVWMGVFFILGTNKILGMGSAAIKGFGQTLAGIAVRAPLAVPIIPLPGGGKMTPLGLPGRANSMLQGLKSGESLSEAFTRSGKAGNPAAAAKSLAQDTRALNDLSTKIQDLTRVKGTEGEKGALEEIKNALRQKGFDTSKIDHRDAAGTSQALKDIASQLRTHQNGTNDGNIAALSSAIEKYAAAKPSAAPAPAPTPAAPPPPPSAAPKP